MKDRQDWNRQMFQALTSKRLSRNKFFARFSEGWSKAIHKRYKIMSSLQREAERLGQVPETLCWVDNNEKGLLFTLESPRLSYKRVVPLEAYECEWLLEQKAIQAILTKMPREALPHV